MSDDRVPDLPTRHLLVRGAEEWIGTHGTDDRSRQEFIKVADLAWFGTAIYYADSKPSGSRWIDSLPTSGHFVYHLCGYKPGVDPEEAVEHIYVGVTGNLRSRMRAHSRKWWWQAVVPDLCELSEHSTRQEAEADEREMIHGYQPAMNRAGRLLVVTSI